MDASIRSRSLALSLLIHGAIFLALFFLIMTTPIPPFPEIGGGSGGVIVNIGYVESASGTVQPMSENTTMNPEINKTVPVKQQEENIATQETEESPISKEKHDAKKTVTKIKTDSKISKEVKNTSEPVHNVDPKAMYKGKTTDSKSQGTGKGTGDQGNPQGDPNSKYYGKSGNGTGPGNGSGIGTGKGDGIGDFDLGGRSIVRKPNIHDSSQETGKVVVDIVVDKTGNVSNVSIGRGSTTANSHLQELAMKAARETKFTPSSTGQEIQRGTITFVFVVQ